MKQYLLSAFFFAGWAVGAAPVVCAQPSDFQTALGYYQKQEWDKAVPYFRSAINRDPGNWEAYQGMGLCFYQMGDSVTALQLIRRSLALHPDNPGLRQFADRLQPPQAPPPPLPRETPAAGKGPKGPPLAPSIWFKISGGYGTASLGDLARAPGGFKTELPLQGFNVSKASTGSDGIGMKAEAGYQLDPGDALSVDVFTDSYAGFNGSADSGPSTTITQKLAPSVLAFECGYYHYWPSPGQRLYAGAGLGYYLGFVAYSQKEEGNSILQASQGSLAGSDLGIHVDCGYERQIIDNLGLALSGEFRLASLSDFTGGQVPGDSNPNDIMGLMVDPQGLVQAGNTTLIKSNGYRWANVDLTGFQINLEAVYYVF